MKKSPIAARFSNYMTNWLIAECWKSYLGRSFPIDFLTFFLNLLTFLWEVTGSEWYQAGYG